MDSLKPIGDNLADMAWACLRTVDGGLRHINTYRAAQHLLARETRLGLATRLATHVPDFCLLGDFAQNDQDSYRSPENRKLALGRLSGVECERNANFILRCARTNVRNAYTLYALRHVSQSVLGDKVGPDALAYIRRASAKLHPDKTHDLDGWEFPGTTYGRYCPKGYKYEHARHGAAGLFALHRALRDLHENPHYCKALMSPSAKLGATLTLAQLTNDTAVATLLASAIGIYAPQLCTILLGLVASAYGAIGVAYAYNSIALHKKSRRDQRCRAVVKYIPRSGL